MREADWTGLWMLWPEGLTVLLGLWALSAAAWSPREGRGAEFVSRWCGLGLLAVGVGCLFVPSGEAFAGAYVSDGLSRVMKFIVLLLSGGVLLMSSGTQRADGLGSAEFSGLMLLAVTGLLVMVSARDLLLGYMGLELSALSSYALAAFDRRSTRASEGALKYFVLGALSSAIFLYGCSFMYGFSGGLGYEALRDATEVGGSWGLAVGMGLALSGLAFKLAAAPFHMWAPDVYGGVPTSVAAFFGGAPKVGVFGMTVRFLYEGFPETGLWFGLLAMLAIGSMLWGSAAGIWQKDVKRLLAYSAVANMGHALAGIATGLEAGVRAGVLYMFVYGVSVVGVFGCLLALRRGSGGIGASGEGSETFGMLEDLRGLSRTRPWLALCMGALMFSLAGIPPLAGFFAKFTIFTALLEGGLWWLGMISALASVVAAFYYLRVVKVMYVDDPERDYLPISGGLGVTLVLCGGFVLVFVFAPVLGYGLASAALDGFGS